MEKLFLLLISSFLLIGCATAYKNNTLQSAKVEAPDIEALPVTADLSVSQQKAKGEAEGKVFQRDILEKEALAKALGQNPPSLDKPDVLVGINVFEEITVDKLKLTVTGYPAYYTNFRTATEKDEPLSMAKASPASHIGHMQSDSESKTERNMYFTVKYIFGDHFDFGLGFGAEWSNGFFIGGEIEQGNRFNSDLFSFDDGLCLGLGLNIGGISSSLLPNDIKLIGGVSAGLWAMEDEIDFYNSWCNYGYCNYEYSKRLMFGGPFAKVRWNGLETGARVLIGKEILFQLSVGYTL
ncbi:MAG: hypothetical protein FWC15_09385 [Fibromonadales bacterium]|nr:hypothetical protein [Fibromonadales bacterium]